MQVIISTEAAPWATGRVAPSQAAMPISAGEVITRNFRGFGCCFNEAGWIALAKVSANERAATLDKMFGAGGMGFSYCRLPIGANDYSASWYSHAPVEGDFALDHFTIARDFENVIPYIRAAAGTRGGALRLFASPWCPPEWLKHPKAYNYGSIVWEPEYLRTYADYFVRFVQAYAAEGLEIEAVHVQNEPDSDQKFPSCLWTGEKLALFIRDYLSLAFKAAGLETEIWLGTIERPSFNDWLAPTILDPQARAAISGAGFQWAGKGAVQKTRQAAPDLPIIQTENECGDGQNTWDYAHYVFDLAQHYLSNGAEAYVYWNAVLEQGGISTWGWKQNSMFCVDDGRVIENPEYFTIRHFAQFVREGAQVLRPTGLGGNALFFRNTDGSEVAVLQNPLATALTIDINIGGETGSVTLPAKSFVTVTA